MGNLKIINMRINVCFNYEKFSRYLTVNTEIYCKGLYNSVLENKRS